jgi:uncharacterized membrane protein
MGRRRRKHAYAPPTPATQRSIEAGSRTETQLIHAEYSGPLPPASQFEHYERVLPGAADRIMSGWERQTSHRQSIETMVVRGNVRAQTTGQYLSAFLTVCCFILAGFLFVKGLAGWAFATVVSDLTAMVIVSVRARRRQDVERNQKNQSR